MRKRTFVIIILFFSVVFFVMAEESSNQDDIKDETTNSEDELKKETTNSEDELKKENISTLNEDRRATLKYGIDSEVNELIDKLIEEENGDFADEIIEIFSETTNQNIMESSVNYLIKINNGEAIEVASRILSEWENQETNIISAALKYVSEFHNEQSENLILPLIENDNSILASSALRALGKCGTGKSAEKLIDLLDDDDYEDTLKQEVIKALGEMKSEAANDVLIDILDDVDEEKSWRWTACEALGKIGNYDSLPYIKNAINDDDLYLRSYAIKALAGFDNKEVEDVLIQALRDSFWKVRVSAAEALAERKSTKAIDILIYKAKKDPEKNVKIAAVESLGKIGATKSFDFLRSIYIKNKTPDYLRKKAAQIIIENDLENSIDKIVDTIANEWEKDKSALLSYTCNYLSKEKNNKLASVFEQMIDNKSIVIKIYGIRGISNNGFSELKDKIKKFDNDKVNISVRKAALDALEKL